MTISVQREPVDFYVGRLLRNEPFSLLMYGDGEFIVAMGERVGQRLAYGEVVTPRMSAEMVRSLDAQDRELDGRDYPPIYRATDLNLIDYESYQGRDWQSIHAYGKRIREFLKRWDPMTFYDGTVWDTASSKGELTGFLKAIHGKDLVLVGNNKLETIPCIHARHVRVPPTDAYASIDQTEEELANMGIREVYIFCMGLGAIPLIIRMRKRFPTSTFMDLGSVLDVLVGMGSERGWRNEMYHNQKEWARVLGLHIEGVCPDDCPYRGK